MLRWILFGFIAVIVAVVSAVRTMPLEYAMGQAGLPNTLVSWTSAQGTITRGRLNTVLLGPQLVGDVLVKQRFINPLSQSVTYDVQWGSAGGRGAGQIVASRDRMIVNELRVQQNLVAMPGLIPAVRELGGNIRVLNASLDIDQKGCNAAEGLITTDVLVRLGNQYGKAFSDLQGPVSCKDGAILIALSASSDTGDRIDVTGNVGISGAGEFNISVETTDSEIRLVLKEYGFRQTDGDIWRYRHQT